MTDRTDGHDLTVEIEQQTHEAAELSLQLGEAMKERSQAELAYLDAKKVREIAMSKERLIRIALQSANRDLISAQARLKVIPR